MHDSLQKFAALPDDTQVYCAHEYTLENIRFAKKVEPANRQLLEREARDSLTREQGRPTLPSTMALEKATNPFLRCEHPTVKAAASHFSGSPLDNAVKVFAAVREWRNRF
jgi:hydroxyacylglutathione hydrolase